MWNDSKDYVLYLEMIRVKKNKKISELSKDITEFLFNNLKLNYKDTERN